VKKLFGFGLPDIGGIQADLNQKFDSLIQHIDALGLKLDALLAAQQDKKEASGA
jgi:hypothetical protein